MEHYGLPVLFALALWWFSTGVILYLDGLPRRTYGASLAAATIVCALACYGLWATRDDMSVSGAYIAFTCGVLVWGWQEMGFLMGFVTGSRRTALPPGARGWKRFVYATQAVSHHEAALLATAAAVVALTWGGANQVGAGTFLILWVMRLSAKLNVFLGVRNLSAEFLPDHLRYLESYFLRRPMNALFPIAITLATGAAVYLWQSAAAAATPFEAVGQTLLATMLTLAIVEHWFLVLPISIASLWTWGLRSREAPPASSKANTA
jgi:putative photosynthetic complex assembly protein 2